MKIKHYDLFAGIGGFSYALDTIFHEQKNEHIFCEWEQFPTAVLKKHWPDETYYGDIADLVADTNSQRWERERKQNEGRYGLSSGEVSDQEQEMVILTGGFPCQPFSHAGRRQGTSDDRYKWPEMFAVIRNVRPDWVIAENVRGLASWNEGMVLETVCADLEAEGYEVRPYIIPACSKGAPHKRERVWIIANRNDSGSGTSQHGNNKYESEDNQGQKGQPFNRISQQSKTTTNTRQQLRESRSSKELETSTSVRTTSPETNQRNYQYLWSSDWQEVAVATCNDGVDDGLPRKLDGATYRGKPTDCISASKHRKDRLKACGNAIVPQIAMEIFKAIKTTI